MDKTKKNQKPAVKAARTEPKRKKNASVALVMTEEQKREAAFRPVNQWRSYIRRLLNEDKSYKRKYTYQVTLAAQSLRLLQECYFQILKNDAQFTISEISREGHSRRAENPLLTMYIKLDAMCRKNLTALGMNMNNLIDDNGNPDDADPLRALMEKMK